MSKNFLVCILLFGMVSLIPSIASSGEIPTAAVPINAKDKPKELKFGIGLGLASVRFDTKMKFTDKSSGQSVFIDPEGSLNLPEVARVNTLYGGYRAGKRHTIGFAYFAVKRESVLIDENFHFDDLTLSGKATLSDDTRFYFLNYGYSLYQDDRSRVSALFGLSGLDLKYTFVAEGDITIGDESREGIYQDEASIFAPLPLFGLNISFNITKQWSIDNKVALIYGKYNDISAGVVQVGMNTKYQFSRRLGVVFGLSSFNANVTSDEDAKNIEVDYGYGGAFAGLHIVF